MLTKEDIKKCLAGEYTPIAPCYYIWLDSKFVELNKDEVVKMKSQFEDDLIFSQLNLIRKANKPVDLCSNEFIDEWGCVFGSSSDGVGAHPTRSIINNIEDWEKYEENGMPGIDQNASETNISNVSLNHSNRYILTAIWRTFYERMYMLVGMEKLWEDMIFGSELFFRMKKGLFDFTIDCLCLASKLGIEGIYLADDWGCQDRLQISPEMWKKYFKRDYAAMIDVAHNLGVDVWMHSCGNITELIPEWIDIGLDVIGNLQPSAMDLSTISSYSRGEITFFGGIDVQFNLVRGTPESILKEVKALKTMFQPQKGKFIYAPSNTIMPETPRENVWALFKAMECLRYA